MPGWYFAPPGSLVLPSPAAVPGPLVSPLSLLSATSGWPSPAAVRPPLLSAPLKWYGQAGRSLDGPPRIRYDGESKKDFRPAVRNGGARRQAPVPALRNGEKMFEAKTDKKTAIFFADGCEEIEGLTVVDLLYRAGIPCTKVSINDRPEVTSSHEVTFRTDTTVGALDFDDYDMLILPGGVPGTPNLRACDKLMDQVTAFCKNGKQIAAICAAPGIFAELGLLRGIPATCNPTRDDLLTESGALLSHEPVVVSGNIITSRAMGTAVPFGLAIVAHYLGQDAAEALRKNILYCVEE